MFKFLKAELRYCFIMTMISIARLMTLKVIDILNNRKKQGIVYRFCDGGSKKLLEFIQKINGSEP